MSKLGELLKSEREKKGLSLHEIGMSLKINAKVLKAIEDGDEKNLPAKTFLRGFVKSYAQYLRLDLSATLQMFQEEYGSTRPEEPKKAGAPVESQDAGIATSPKFESSLRRTEDSALPVNSTNRVYTIIGALILLMLIAFVTKMMDKYQKESRVSKTEVIAAVEAEKKTEVSIEPTKAEAPVETQMATPISGGLDTTTTSSSSTTLATVPTPVLPIITTTTSTTSTTTSTATTTTSTTLRPTTTTSSTVKVTTTIKPTTTTQTTLKSAVEATITTTTTLKPKNTEVIVEALSKITVRFTLNDGKQETLELSPDEVHTFRSKGALQLEISDGGAVNIILNGRDRGVPGTIGKPIKLSY